MSTPTLDNILHYIAIGLCLHIGLKPLYFLQPYRRRRANLDKAYGHHPAAPLMIKGDNISVGISVILIGLVLQKIRTLQMTETHFTSSVRPKTLAEIFIYGVWIGATLTQVFFHRFRHQFKERDGIPTRLEGQLSPIKQMSYAVQDAPELGATELGLFMAVAGWAFTKIVMS